MSRRKNKLLSLALALCMVFSLFTALPTTAQAADYADRMALGTWNGDGTNPGDGHRYITFGSYNGHNLVWRVLEVTNSDPDNPGNKTAFLLLDDFLRDNDGAVETRQFHNSGNNDWNGSDVKAWLNGDASGQFLENFDGGEKNAIVTSGYTYGGPNSGAGTAASSQVFLLSVEEAENPDYFENNADRTMDSGNWWLRSPGFRYDFASLVSNNGLVNAYGDNVYSSYGIRPALKINLESGIFTSSEISYDITVQIVDGSSDIAGARVSLSGASAPDTKFSDSGGRATFGRFSAGDELTLTVEKVGYAPHTETFTVGEGEPVRSVTLMPDGSPPDRVYFGRYGGNPILWRVLDLDRADGRALLLTDGVVGDRGAWSDINSWINDGAGFLAGGNFTAAERGVMLNYNETSADVFLLSADEARLYMPDDASRGLADEVWWLRSSPYAGQHNVVVGDGLISGTLDTGNYSARPAMWVDLDKLTLSGGNTLSADTLHSAAVTVTDGTNPIDGAAVTLTAPNGDTLRKCDGTDLLTAATSGGTGAAFTLPAGEYDVAVTAYGYQNGSGTLTVASSGTNTAEITLTVNPVPQPPSGGTSTPRQPTTKIGDVDVNYNIGSDGTVTLKPTPEQLEKLLATIGEDGVLRITVSGINGMKSAVIEIDLSKLTASNKLQVFNFSVADMEISFPAGALRSMQKLAKTLRFGLKPGSLIFELNDTGGKAIEWYDYANPVTVSMDYEPPQDISAHQVVMTRKDGEIIPRSWYSGGKVYAKVSEPGTYDAAVKPLGSFTDTAGLWMNEAVGYMSARGIVEGVGGNLFDRGGTITRAHFVTMLMRALAVEAAADDDALPVDYADAPEWAQAHIASAVALGITLEDENGKFSPGAAITRQDMFFMAYQAMQSCGMLPDAITTQFIIFSDWDDVTDEYGGALQTLAILGLVRGNGDGTLNPNGSSTRAEGAQFLYNILKFDAK